MYSIDAQDLVHELPLLPQFSVGAPSPMILAGNGVLHLAYLLDDEVEAGSDEAPEQEGAERPEPCCVLVRFRGVSAHSFGSPGDETLDRHPLFSRGLQPYAISEVKNSSWIRQMERMNSTHPSHQPARFARLRHYVFTFKDETLECLAEGFEFSLQTESVATALFKSWRVR